MILLRISPVEISLQSQVWWNIPIILALGGAKAEDQKFKASLHYFKNDSKSLQRTERTERERKWRRGKGKRGPHKHVNHHELHIVPISGSYLLEVQFTHYNRAENSVVTRDSLRYSSILWWCWSKEIHCAASHIKTQRMWQHVVYSMWLWQWTAMLLNCRYTITIFSSVLILNLL